MERTPNPEIKTGLGMLPNSFHKTTMTMAPLDDCEKIYHNVCVPCPWIKQYVSPIECETCKHGKMGSYSEGWVMCNYRSLSQTAEEKEE